MHLCTVLNLILFIKRYVIFFSLKRLLLSLFKSWQDIYLSDSNTISYVSRNKTRSTVITTPTYIVINRWYFQYKFFPYEGLFEPIHATFYWKACTKPWQNWAVMYMYGTGIDSICFYNFLVECWNCFHYMFCLFFLFRVCSLVFDRKGVKVK